MTDKDRLLRDYSAVHFAALETALYLDTHPRDAVALKAMKQYAERSRALKKEYEEKYGMIEKCSPLSSDDKWTWADGPWPWQ